MTFKVNGVTYKSAAVDFNTVCFFEDNGLNFSDVHKKGHSFIRAYFALCAGISVEDAGVILNEHVVKGGNIDGIVEAFKKEIDKSDFFRAAKTDKNKEDAAESAEVTEN